MSLTLRAQVCVDERREEIKVHVHEGLQCLSLYQVWMQQLSVPLGAGWGSPCRAPCWFLSKTKNTSDQICWDEMCLTHSAKTRLLMLDIHGVPCSRSTACVAAVIRQQLRCLSEARCTRPGPCVTGAVSWRPAAGRAFYPLQVGTRRVSCDDRCCTQTDLGAQRRSASVW